MQNIALIIDTLQGGGAERCAADLSLIFSQRGFQVFIFTDLSIKIEYDYEGTLVDYSFALLSMGKTQSTNSLQDRVSELRELKRKYHIDIAISFMQPANYFNILSRDIEKVILTTHSVNSEYAKYEKSVFWAEETFRDLYQYADLITFPSDFCRDDWLKHYGDKNHITRTVYNPVHMMQVKANDYKENIVIAVGRMHCIKRQWHLIKAFSLVKEACPDSKLILLGEGELRSKLEMLVKKFGLTQDVEMPGNVKNIQEYLAKAKVFVMTSRYEAMPCAVLEALSAGVPVVACDSPGGIREELGISHEPRDISTPIIGECGIITPYITEKDTEDISWEEEVLASEIVHLLSDDSLRRRMAAAAVKTVQRFAADQIASLWIDDIFNNCQKRKVDQDEFEKIREKNIESFHKQEMAKIRMYVSYYRLLEKWMTLREKGGRAEQYFTSRGMKKIIIYGLGKMANHLLEDLKGSDINIVCAIDRNVINKYGEFPIITLEEKMPEADCIIITPVHEAEVIKKNLTGRTLLPIISLSEVIDDCMQ